MPGWLVTAGLVILVAVLLLAFGSSELVTILVVLFLWFFVLASLALAFEVFTQRISRRFRR